MKQQCLFQALQCLIAQTAAAMQLQLLYYDAAAPMQLHINQRQSLSSLTAVCSCITAAQAAPQQLATARELLMAAPMQLHVNQRQSLSSPSAVCSCIVAAQAAPQQLATAKELLMAAPMQPCCSSLAVAQLP